MVGSDQFQDLFGGEGSKTIKSSRGGSWGRGIAVEVGLGKVAAVVREMLMSVTFLVK